MVHLFSAGSVKLPAVKLMFVLSPSPDSDTSTRAESTPDPVDALREALMTSTVQTAPSTLSVRDNHRNDRAFDSETISRANFEYVFTWLELPIPPIAGNVLP